MATNAAGSKEELKVVGADLSLLIDGV